MPDPTQQIEELANQVADLKKLVDALVVHNHLGIDGSLEFQGETNFRGRSITIAGGITKNSRIVLPIAVTDGIDQEWLKPGAGQRLAASGLAVVGEKGSAGEQDNHMIAVAKPGKAFSSDPTIPPNQIDWNDSAQSFVRLILGPQSTPFISGPSVVAPLGFVTAERSPIVQGSTGSLTTGGSTFIDSLANFIPDNLVGSILSLESAGGSVLESYIILTNTQNVLTLGTFTAQGGANLAAWELPTGSYPYSIRTPVLLGEAEVPFTRVYVGEDIRMGYGSSDGGQVRYIKWGIGDPNGVVTANIGSLYLDFTGGSGSVFYVKESGNRLATGWVAK